VPTIPTEAEVLTWFDALSNWGRWGDDDRLGTMNYITPSKRAAAARLVRDGVTVSCAWDIDTVPRVDHVAGPAQRFMLGTGEAPPAPGVRGGGAMEFIGLVYHGYTVTHLDGLSHIFWDGRMYNGRPASRVTAWGGALDLPISDLATGVVTRGVLLDVAGDTWLEPGTGVFPEDLEAAEARQGVSVAEGDVVLLRTGYGRMVRERGHYNVRTEGRAGWHPACLPWLHERGVAAIAGDTACGNMPHPDYPSIHDPVHAIGIVAMGLWLIDNCDLEALHTACSERGRWEFLFMLSPLRVVGGTGSPANPLAIF
jgi:kynurenine formamidase